ncbi:MAG: type VI secretion system protein TssA [Burkholderiaceae bacterium]|jgi:type VI secretion system protein ImpA|nr:type VI secretion system protein TssA [Burkholderiaceae bacterium]
MQDIDTGIDWGKPVSEDQPAGPDMQYASEFAELEAAATGTPEQEYGDVLIPAKGPEWQRIFELTVGLSRQTHDLRVLLLMSRALTRLHGVPGLLNGIQALDTVLKRQWDDVHPQLIVDGINDPHIRYGVLSEFGDPDGLVGDLRQAIVLRSPLAAFTVRDMERVAEQGSVDVNGVAISRQQIDDMVIDMRQTAEMAALLDVPSRLVELLNGLLQNIEQRCGPDFTPNLTNLLRPLERVGGLFGSGVLAGSLQTEDGSALLATDAVSTEVVGGLKSRADVVRAMSAICAYLERHEPTNPVPLLIRRAQRLMTMSFLDIVKDLSPDGLNQVLNVTGAEADDAAGS